MESKINIVRKDLRALKRSSHAIEKLIEAQGIHFVRINALEKMEQNEQVKRALEKEKEHLEKLGLAQEIEKSVELEGKYLNAISSLPLIDRAILTDSFVKGKSNIVIAMDYGFSEGGIRKRITRLIEKIAKSI